MFTTIVNVASHTGTIVSVTGNITAAGAVFGAGNISTTGNIQGGNIIGNVVGNLSSTSASLTGNLTANNVIATTIANAASHTGTIVSVTGNVTANNVIATTIANAASHTGGLVSVTGSITGGSRSIAKASLPAGSVLQVVNTFSNTIQTVNGNSFVALASMNTAITPTSSTSTVLINVSINFGGAVDLFPAFRLFRDATFIGNSAANGAATTSTFSVSTSSGGAAATVEMGLASYTFLDSPATTSAVTYSVQVSPKRTATNVFVLNSAGTVGDANQNTGTSTMTLMEIAV